jgi:hypothetical protein
MRLALLPLVLLVACQVAPIVQDLKETTLFFNLIAPTGGSVMYAKATEFDQPILGVRSVKITGMASVNGLTQPITVVVYARSADPAAACALIDSLYRCAASNEVPLSSSLTFSPAAPSVALNFSSDTLPAAVNQGKVWLGLKVVSGRGNNIAVKFSEMRATVTLF